MWFGCVEKNINVNWKYEGDDIVAADALQMCLCACVCVCGPKTFTSSDQNASQHINTRNDIIASAAMNEWMKGVAASRKLARIGRCEAAQTQWPRLRNSSNSAQIFLAQALFYIFVSLFAAAQQIAAP